MSELLVDRIPFAKIITVLAIVFGISLGLCGVTFAFSAGSSHDGSFFVGPGILGMVAFGVSIAGLLLALLVFVTLSIFGGFSAKVSQSTISPKLRDDTKIDKNE